MLNRPVVLSPAQMHLSLVHSTWCGEASALKYNLKLSMLISAKVNKLMGNTQEINSELHSLHSTQLIHFPH